MRDFLCCLVLTSLPALGQSGVVTPVALYTHFQEPHSQAVFDAIQREVAGIMAPLGFPFDWRSLDGASSRDAAAELAVVTFRGSCSIENMLMAKKASGPLGITHMTDGVVLPFAEVDCERTLAFLRTRLIHTDASGREAAFGRAVGRVLAHELFHVFVGSTHHGSGGLSEPAFTEVDLMSDRFQFNAVEFRLLRASLKGARRQNSRVRNTASALSGRFIFGENGCPKCHGAFGEGTQSAPALHAAHIQVDPKTMAAKLSKDVLKMYRRAKAPRLPVPSLDDDEVADVASFLNSLN